MGYTNPNNLIKKDSGDCTTVATQPRQLHSNNLSKNKEAIENDSRNVGRRTEYSSVPVSDFFGSLFFSLLPLTQHESYGSCCQLSLVLKVTKHERLGVILTTFFSFFFGGGMAVVF